MSLWIGPTSPFSHLLSRRKDPLKEVPSHPENPACIALPTPFRRLAAFTGPRQFASVLFLSSEGPGTASQKEDFEG